MHTVNYLRVIDCTHDTAKWNEGETIIFKLGIGQLYTWNPDYQMVIRGINQCDHSLHCKRVRLDLNSHLSSYDSLLIHWHELCKMDTKSNKLQITLFAL